jgi:chromosome segregation ATPase
VNRIVWDLRGEPSTEVRLRTSPLHAPEITVGPQGWRSGGGQVTILQPPGMYSVKLSAGGRELTQPLTVKKDPHSEGTEAEIEEQMRTLEQLRTDVEATAAMVNELELLRSQLQNLPRLLDQTRDADVRKDAAALEQKLIAIEGNLIELRATGRGQDTVRWGAKLLGKINYLANELASADNRPTNQQLEVQKLHHERIATYRGQLDALVGTDLAAFNETMKRRNLPVIVWPTRSGT